AEPKRGLAVRLANLHWIDAFVARGRAIDEGVRSVRPSSAGTPPYASRPIESDEARARWTPPPKAQPASTLPVPWTPVQTLRGARVLTLIGASWFGLLALEAAAVATALALFHGVWVSGVIVNSVLAVLFVGCAVGTYVNWRVASLAGFALVFVTWVPSISSSPAIKLGVMSALPAIAGILGTFATARLLSTGVGHRQRGTA